jgi:hypothetical protein
MHVRNNLRQGREKCQTACKPGSVFAAKRRMTIHLGRPLPNASRDRPGWRRGSPPEPKGSAIPTWSCSRWGLPCRRRCRKRGALLPHHFTLAAGCSRSWAGLAVCFCGTFPRVAPAGRYPAPCFHGARTFLPRLAARAVIRPSGRAHKGSPFSRCQTRGISLPRSRGRQPGGHAPSSAKEKQGPACPGQEIPCSRIEIRWQVSASAAPSQHSGLKWRWKAVIVAAVSASSTPDRGQP